MESSVTSPTEDSPQLIEFLRPDRPLSRQQAQVEHYDNWEQIPHPVPAAEHLPEWFRQLPGLVHDDTLGTVKRCPPFLDSLSAGYLLPFPDWAEIRLTSDQEWSKRGPGQIFLGFHPPEQFAGSWFGGQPIVKFDSPWIIRTPPGYSTLFLAPLNRANYPLQSLSGIVETDQYYSAVAFPMLLLDRTLDTIHRIERGTFLVQVIPFRRDTWTMQVDASDYDQWMQTRKELRAEPFNVYRNRWHVKKSFH